MEMQITESSEKDYLLSLDAVERVFGRLSATSAGDEVKAWVEAEIDRGTEIFDILMALANWANSIHASITGSMYERNQHHLGRRMFIKVIENSYSKIAKRCFEEVHRSEAEAAE
jgi:hypothetical protein